MRRHRGSLVSSSAFAAAIILIVAAGQARGQCTGCAKTSFGGPPSVGNTSVHDDLAVADFDQDGRLDVVVPNANQATR
jgi:hypothetical protein